MTVEIVPHRRLRDRLRRPTHIVRVMSPSGVYPDSTIVSADSLFYVGEAICFSVVPYDPEERNNFEFYSEVEWATLREIRLYGSILISTRREESYVAIYPYRHPFYLFLNESLKYKRTQRRIRDALVTHLSTNCRETYPFRGMTAPPAVGGPAYDLRENAIRRDWQCMIETNIDINDHLLIRGLSTLLRAVMVWQHPQFAEEAINTIFISLDASFQIVLRTLETRGYKNASALCEFSPIWSHFVFGIKAPADFRRNGATGFSA